MALDTFIAGRYSGTYNSVDVGITDQGYEIQQTVKQEMIDESDAYGLTTIDWIQRGMDCFLQFISKAYKAGSLGAFAPWGAGVLGKFITTAQPIAVLASAIAQSMVLTVVANTPAAAASAINTLTATLALNAPNYDGRILLDSRLRKVPIRLQLLPSISSGTVTCFTLT